MDEFVYRVEGFRKQKILQWEHTRVMAFSSIKPHLKNQNLKIENFFPLESDKMKGIASIKSPEERRAASIKLKQLILEAAKRSKN